MSPPGRLAPWMILAMILVGVTIWVAGKVAFSTPPGTYHPAITLDPGLAVRSEERPRPDAIRQFTAKARKGMTLRELRWIVEDFQNAGLDLPDGENALPPDLLAARQKRWYVEALAAGLALDGGEKEAARHSLKALAAGGARWDAVDPPLPQSCPEWLRLAEASPWRLIPSLPPGTLALTRPPDTDEKSGDLGLPNVAWEPPYPGQILEMPAAPAGLRHAAFVFPFTFDQRFPEEGEDLPTQLTALHPAQFQVLLLIDGLPPGLAERLEAQSE